MRIPGPLLIFSLLSLAACTGSSEPSGPAFREVRRPLVRDRRDRVPPGHRPRRLDQPGRRELELRADRRGQRLRAAAGVDRTRLPGREAGRGRLGRRWRPRQPAHQYLDGAARGLSENAAGFELFGGPDQIGVDRVAAGPAGWLVGGARTDRNGKAGAAVWLSGDGRAFQVVDDGQRHRLWRSVVGSGATSVRLVAAGGRILLATEDGTVSRLWLG